MRKRMISVIGGSPCTPDESRLARAVGRGIGEAGAILVCGGHGGVMAAAAEGAAEAGGVTVGLLPGDDPSAANPHIQIPIATGMGPLRNALVACAGEAIIAIGGGAGTLSEIAFGRIRGKRVIALESWSPPGQGVLQADTPEEAIRLALAGRED